MTTEELTVKLNELKTMLDGSVITQVEHERLRQRVMEEFANDFAGSEDDKRKVVGEDTSTTLGESKQMLLFG